MQIPLEQRVSFLKALPGFDVVPDRALATIATALSVEDFAAAKEIVHERDLGDRLYLIVSGTAAVSVAGAHGGVDLGELGPGEMFGEIALLTEAKRRRATVTALTPTVTLTLTQPDFEELVRTYPEIQEELSIASDALMNARLKALIKAKAEAEK